MGKVVIKRLAKYTHADGIPDEKTLFEDATEAESKETGVSKGKKIPKYLETLLKKSTIAPFEAHINEQRITSQQALAPFINTLQIKAYKFFAQSLNDANEVEKLELELFARL